MSTITGTPSISQSEPADVSVGGRHSGREITAARSSAAASPAAATDVVELSEIGRTLSRIALDGQEVEIQLSPDKLREMVTPKQNPNSPAAADASAAVDAPRE